MAGPFALVLVVTLALVPVVAAAQSAVAAAHALVARYHEDPAGLDRAREILEAALASDRQVDTMVMLSYVHFLWGDIRAGGPEEKLAAYERGRTIGQRAVELAPRNTDAHLWYAINTGRWGQTKGVMRSLMLLPTMRQEIDTILTLDPRNVRGHVVAGGFYFEVPGLFGGDRAKAERYLRRALELDPRFTVARVDLARILIATGRHADARRELQRVIDERRPTIVPDWTVKDLPRAHTLLESIRDK